MHGRVLRSGAVNRNLPGVHLLLNRRSSGGEFDEVVISTPYTDRLVDGFVRGNWTWLKVREAATICDRVAGAGDSR